MEPGSGLDVLTHASDGATLRPMATTVLVLSLLLLVVALALALARYGVEPRYDVRPAHALVAVLGMAFGVVGLGWFPPPDESAIREAVLRRAASDLAAAYLRELRRNGMRLPDPATARRWDAERRGLLASRVVVRSVHRRWLHELIGPASEFEVRVVIAHPDGREEEGCWHVEPVPRGGVEAHGPLFGPGC